MNITEVRVKLIPSSGDRLKAFCSVTFDSEFVVRDLKIIEGSGGEFVAMPSRKLSDRCAKCGAKNHLRARYCNECGAKLNDQRAGRDRGGRTKLHADVAHPINAECRERIQQAVIEAYQEELRASQQPDYKPKDYDEYDESDADLETTVQTHAGEADEQDAEKDLQPQRVSDSEYDFDDQDDDAESDYNSLIRDLKKDAEKRRAGPGSQKAPVRSPDRRDRRRPSTPGPSSVGPAEESPPEDADEAPAAHQPPGSKPEPGAPKTDPVPPKPEPPPAPHPAPALQPSSAKTDSGDDEEDPMDSFGAGIL